jgi:hypothetical protein
VASCCTSSTMMQHYAAVALLAALAGLGTSSPRVAENVPAGRIAASGTLLPLGAHGERSQKFVSSFRLVGKSRVSAGVFATNGTLITTLFSNKEMDSGVHDVSWNWPKGATRDDGLEVRVLAYNVTYEWEGVIGNTGESP